LIKALESIEALKTQDQLITIESQGEIITISIKSEKSNHLKLCEENESA
jgi:hypothetical protein